LVWLDSCDKHRNEEIKQAAAGGPNLDTPLERFQAVCPSILVPVPSQESSQPKWLEKTLSAPQAASLPSSR